MATTEYPTLSSFPPLSAEEIAALPPPPKLAHSYNSRGELGMFVNPWACSCETCEDYKSSRRAEPADAPAPTPVSLTTVPPSLPPPRPLSEVLAAEALVQLHRSTMFSSAPALGRTVTGFHYRPSDDDEEEDGIGPTESVTYTGIPRSLGPSPAGVWAESLRPSATGSWVSILSPPPPAPTGGIGLSSRAYGAVRFWTPDVMPSTIKVTLTPEQMATLKSGLREYTEYLTEQQGECDHEGCRSHDEMAAQDMLFDELDRKIMEIDDILAVLAAAEEE